MPSFSDIIGQDKAVSFISRILKGSHPPHAYLFVGPEGVGKKKAALALAGALNCTESGPHAACMTCTSCHKIDRGTHPDVFLVSPQGELIAVDQVRDLIGSLSYAPFEGRMKIAVIDSAERMHWSASNALLKTLEEPPPRTVLVLLTSSPDALPSTVLSRCQKIRFSPLQTGTVARWLEESHGWPGDRAALAASLSGGVPGRAMGMNDEFLEMRRALIDRLLPSSSAGLRELFDAAKKYGKQDLRGSLDIVEGVLADILRMSLGREGMVMNRDVMGDLTQAVRWYGVTNVVGIYDSVMKIRESMSRNINPELAMDALFLDAVTKRRKGWAQ